MNDVFPYHDDLDDLKIAVIGGGTGSFTLLKSLKDHSHAIAALVNMADDGGSSGVLRDELGTLPPGDIRQCLVALSDSPKVRELFDYRFDAGTFKGHAFGNLLLSALEKMTGSFSEAVETASEILRINGVVIPATLDNVRLKMEWPETSVVLHGEGVIDAKSFENDPRKAALSLVPNAKANPAALLAIDQADLIVIAPGDLYTSLGPLLVIEGIGDALRKTQAKIVYVSNLVTKHGQTEGFTVADHADEIERFGGGKFLDCVLYNQQIPDRELAEKYEAEKAYLVEVDLSRLKDKQYTAVGGDFLGNVAKAHANDSLPVTRSLIRHDSARVARAIIELYNSLNVR
jgi:uncharacterized cofD-like protein